MLRQSCKRVLGQSKLASKSIWCRLYHERLADHYKNPRNIGSFDKNDPDVGTGDVRSPVSRDSIKLQIKVEHETRKIVDVRAMPFGGSSVKAGSSLATEWVKGKQIEEASKINYSKIAKHFSIPLDVKLQSTKLAEDAIKAAIKDYEAKHGKHTSGSSSVIGDYRDFLLVLNLVCLQ